MNRCRICGKAVDYPRHHLLTVEESRVLAYRLMDVYDVISIAKNRKITANALTNSIHKFCGKISLCLEHHRRIHNLVRVNEEVFGRTD